MKIDYSLITRRTFLNTLLNGWLLAFFSGTIYALIKFAFPTLGKEPDFVVLNADDYMNIPLNSVKPFAWGGKAGLFFRKSDGTVRVMKGVCTHMDCNISYKEKEKKFYCACHEGWYDEDGKNIKGPPPKPLDLFDIKIEGRKIFVFKKGIKIDFPKV